MKKKAVMVAGFSLAVLVSSAGFANPDDQDNPGGPFRRPGAGAPDQHQFLTMLMRQFDKDDDQKLDSQELTALLTSLRERQAQMGGQGPLGPMQANRFRPSGPGGMEGRRGGGDGNDEAGGVSPKRPPVEE